MQNFQPVKIAHASVKHTCKKKKERNLGTSSFFPVGNEVASAGPASASAGLGRAGLRGALPGPPAGTTPPSRPGRQSGCRGLGGADLADILLLTTPLPQRGGPAEPAGAREQHQVGNVTRGSCHNHCAGGRKRHPPPLVYCC